MLLSNYAPLRAVDLPLPRDRQFYMHTFELANPSVPKGFEDYLEPVRQLVRASGATLGVAHLTIDEKIVKAGMSQRRPKPHVDGCFIPQAMVWGHEPSPVPGWAHYCNSIAGKTFARMPVIVAASAAGCRAWRGIFDGMPKPDGDLSHISDQLGRGEVLTPNYGYILSPDCVHESMPFDADTPRTFIRIALPNDFAYDF